MDDKKGIIRLFIPSAVLKPMTDEALKAVPETYLKEGLIAVSKFPYRIGRESRVRRVKGQLVRYERPMFEDRLPNNDLYLVDSGEKLNISREHLQIEKVDDLYYITDRGSFCGIRIDDGNIGGNGREERKKLNDGDLIHIGCSSTPYIYQFLDLEKVWMEAKELSDIIECFRPSLTDEEGGAAGN